MRTEKVDQLRKEIEILAQNHGKNNTTNNTHYLFFVYSILVCCDLHMLYMLICDFMTLSIFFLFVFSFVFCVLCVCIERDVDRKDAIIQMLIKDLDDAEEQFQTAQRTHMQRMSVLGIYVHYHIHVQSLVQAGVITLLLIGFAIAVFLLFCPYIYDRFSS